ncbi:MAG: HEAT repeat domain-containing protein, partial [Chloroflexi bacterium]|nr:HEAT repeat domain-containing protein [Chloroflexota bacterium]
MLTDLIQQLRSSDPAQRRAAIIALANTKNPAATNHLTAIQHNDPDPELRELALKAETYIHQHTALGKTDSPATDARPGGKVGQMLDAVQANLDNNNHTEARKLLNKLLWLKPSLSDDPNVIQMAVVLTGYPVDEAVAALADPEAVPGAKYIPRPRPQKPKEESLLMPRRNTSFQPRWAQVGLDLLIYWTAVVLVTFGFLAFLFYTIIDAFED